MPNSYWLTRLLTESGMSRYRLAQLTGISQQYLAKMTREQIPPEAIKYGHIQQLIRVFPDAPEWVHSLPPLPSSSGTTSS